ncbi:hypothetical protein Adeg_0411 [Ammonifex degensii KC4]|uniref:DNA-binding protein n=1 Tax=Ammonifex degensii (strain DSM 10501 / KC4) TaxID=429009 RepID=C9RBD7_AMMDK|nr:helix-turn-helix domain-containing protein [Ammonifex degensii]ACX51564.1 hypothetical protein Adeg_0411 [Ammonifex degensii KC4]
MHKHTPHSWEELPLVLTPGDLVKYGITPGKASAYALLRLPGFPARRVGRRWLIGRDALRAWLEKRDGE